METNGTRTGVLDASGFSESTKELIREIVREEIAAHKEQLIQVDADEFAKQLAVNVDKTLRDIFGKDHDSEGTEKLATSESWSDLSTTWEKESDKGTTWS
ncbi:hypothetical protein [Paenibacillus sp. FSL L8-0708]|uniref:hypothetical protein n=1 Tax=Paenibacillus sp. FSL L8-0708 TaxID=2975311 RepID=UPI0030FD0F02